MSDAFAPAASVIISARHQGVALDKCLNTLFTRLPEDVAVEVVLVLNAATPEVEKAARRHADRLRLLRSPIHLGFAASFNRGRAAASGRFLVSLHADAFVQPGWLEALLAAAAEHPEAGVFCSLVMNLDGTTQSAGTLIWRSGQATAPWLDHPPPPAAFTAVQPIQAGAATSLMVRSEVLDALGGLDERLYPGFFADLDLAMGAWAAKRSTLLVPESRAHHAPGTGAATPCDNFLYAWNQGRFAAKWASELARHPVYAATAERIQEAQAWVSQRGSRLAAGRARRPALGPSLFRFDAAEQTERVAALALEVAQAYGAQLERDLDAHAAAIHARDRELARLQVQAGAASESLAERDIRIDTLTNQLAERDNRLTGTLEWLGERQERLAVASAALGQRDVEVATLSDQLVERDKRLAATLQWLAQRENRLAALSEELGRRDVEVATLSDQLVERDKRLAATLQWLARREDRLAALSEELGRRDVEVATLSDQLGERDSRLAATLRWLAEREDRLGTLTGELAARDARIAGLGDELGQRDARIAAALQSLAEREDELASLAAETGALDERLRALEQSSWHRLYRRLLPLLRPLAKLRPGSR